MCYSKSLSTTPPNHRLCGGPPRIICHNRQNFTNNTLPHKHNNQKHNLYKAVKKQTYIAKNNNIVVNVSKYTLSLQEINILNKGLNFGITNNKNTNKLLLQYNTEIDSFIMKLQIKYIFSHKQDSKTHQKITSNPDWQPPPSQCNQHLIGFGLFLKKQFKKLLKTIKIKHNMSHTTSDTK